MGQVHHSSLGEGHRHPGHGGPLHLDRFIPEYVVSKTSSCSTVFIARLWPDLYVLMTLFLAKGIVFLLLFREEAALDISASS